MKNPTLEPIGEVETAVIAIPLLMCRSFNIRLHLLHPAPVGLTTAPLHFKNNRLNLKLLRLQLNWTLQAHHVPKMLPNLTQSPALRRSSLPHPLICPLRHSLLMMKTRALQISPLLGAEKGNFDIEPRWVELRSARLVTALPPHFLWKLGSQKRGIPIGTLK